MQPRARAYLLAILGFVGTANCYQPSFFHKARDAKPPTVENPGIASAAAKLDDYLADFASNENIDSLLVAVGTSAGPLWYKGYGTTRANESVSGPPPDLDTIYRIGSVTKLFTALDTLILRDQGVLSWDDPVDKYIPSFAYQPYGWSTRNSSSEPVNRPPITLRQLASHLSGIGGNYPFRTLQNPTAPGDQWNYTVAPSSVEALLADIRSYPLVVPQYTFPVYSNAGFSVLGLAELAASQQAAAAKDAQGVGSYSELIQKDIFEPVGMNSSFFTVPPGFEKRLAVSRLAPLEADGLLADVDWPAGGQASSSRDLLTLLAHFLAPSDETILKPTTINEWFRPLHAWNDGLTQVGAPWEIFRLPTTTKDGNTFDLYTKSGDLETFHASFAVDQATGYGIVVMITGVNTDAPQVAVTAAEQYLHPAFRTALVEANKEAFAGTYEFENYQAVISMDQEALWMDKLVVNGNDFLQAVGGANVSEPVALWPARGTTEFRLGYGISSLNHNPRAGCQPYWINFDPAFANGAPIDVVYFEDNGDLTIPALNVTLPKVK